MSTGAVTHWKTKAQEIQAKYNRFRTNIKEHSERGAKVISGSLLTAGGGALAAVLDEKMATIPGLNVDSKLVVGAALVSASVLDLAGDYGEQMTEVGSGLLAVVAYDATKKALNK